MAGLDRIIHEPVRLRIASILAGVETADFKFMISTLGLSKGNLSSHIDKLEQAGYVEVRKSFNGKIPRTDYALTQQGRKALSQHWGRPGPNPRRRGARKGVAIISPRIDYRGTDTGFLARSPGTIARVGSRRRLS